MVRVTRRRPGRVALHAALLLCVSLSAPRPARGEAWPGWLLRRHRITLPSGCSQLVLVTAARWGAARARLRRYVRERSRWRPVGPELAAFVGSAGLGWGRGLHRGRRAGPTKREGDRRSPAGAFDLGTAFGRAAERPYAPGRWPWRQVDRRDRLVDDPRSPLSNTWQRASVGQRPPWRSAEDLSHYELGLIVEHNTRPVQPGAGSAIFLHPPGGSEAPTVGCTALGRDDLLRLLRWLDPDRRPVLVQLPER